MISAERAAVVLVSLGSARFTEANCRRLVDAAERLEARDLTCVLLDTLEVTNLQILFGLSEREAADAVTERIIRVRALLRSGAGPIRKFVRLADFVNTLVDFEEQRRTIQTIYDVTETFANAVHNQTFRNLHPVLKRLGIRNSRSPIVKELAVYLLEELSLRSAIARRGDWFAELSFTDDFNEITTALRSHGVGHDRLAFLPIQLVEPLGSAAGVEMRGVTFTYRRSALPAVRNCSFLCPPAEIVGVLGKSGSGKSTLLKLIAGHLRPAAGEIEIGGKSVVALAPDRRGIATVFQDFALFPHLTVRDNVAFGLEANRHYTTDDVDVITEVLLRRFDLVPVGHRLPKDISGGQRQRTAIARALASAPKVLLLDEPTASLDFEARDELVGVLWHLISVPPAPTILLVSHDRDFVLEVAAHLVVISDGTVVGAGPATEIASSPTSPTVARVVGTHVLVPLGPQSVATQIDQPGTANSAHVALVREHALSIKPDGRAVSNQGKDGYETVSGRIIAVTSAASGLRIIVRIGGRDVRVRIPHGSLSDRLEPGFSVRLSFKREDSQILEDEKG